MKCKACGLEHNSWIRCEVALATLGQAGKGPATSASNEAQASGLAPVAPQIKQALEFIKKVGRPKLGRTQVEKRRMRSEYMRRYRKERK